MISVTTKTYCLNKLYFYNIQQKNDSAKIENNQIKVNNLNQYCFFILDNSEGSFVFEIESNFY